MQKALLILTLLPFFAFQCKKDINKKCLKGKVVRISCASYVIQVLNDNSIGEDQWKDATSEESKTYDNVFNVTNKCKIPATYKEGDIIFFKVEAPQQNDCVACAMYDAPPSTQFQIKNISSISCE